MKRLGHSERKRGLRIHCLVFVLTMVLLAGINVWTGAPWWVVYALLSWGVGVIAHWWFVLGPGEQRPSSS